MWEMTCIIVDCIMSSINSCMEQNDEKKELETVVNVNGTGLKTPCLRLDSKVVNCSLKKDVHSEDIVEADAAILCFVQPPI